MAEAVGTGLQLSRMETSLIRRVSPGIPYLAVLLGLYVMRNAWIAIGVYHLGMVAVLLWERRIDTLRALFRGFHPGLFCMIVAICLIGGGVTYLGWPLLGLPHFAERLARTGLTADILPWFFLYFSLVNPMLEETFWRGYHGDPSPQPVWHDLWFAGYHLPVLALFMHWRWLPLMLGGLVAIAWIWRLLVRRLDGLLINYSSHVAADAGIALAVLLLLRR
ncbi:MAG TPA: CPBP family glutamic-type intramembrane protease [Armatimonadota bacterium]|nr:CPBP family glutamic-type intramembrane protease [Armatimonadota bacterium]